MGDFSYGSVCSMCGRFTESGVMKKRGASFVLVCFECADACLISRGSELPPFDEREAKNSEKRVRRLIRSISAGGR